MAEFRDDILVLFVNHLRKRAVRTAQHLFMEQPTRGREITALSVIPFFNPKLGVLIFAAASILKNIANRIVGQTAKNVEL